MKKCINIGCIILVVICFLCSCTTGTSEKEEELPELKIGSDLYASSGYIDESGNPKSIDIELATEVCKRLNMKPVFVDVPWFEKDKWLEDGKIDCIWGIFSMNGRESKYLWAGPYMHSKQVAVVRGESGIYRLSDLNGKTISAQANTKPEEILLKRGNIRLPQPQEILSFETLNLAFSALQTGYSDAVVGHKIALKRYIDTSHGRYRILDETLISTSLGVAFYKDGDKDLAEKTDKTIKEMITDGTVGDIVDKYAKGMALEGEGELINE